MPELTPEQLLLLDEPIHVLGLDVRTTNSLEDPRYPPTVRTVRELLMCQPADLLQNPNVGDKTVTKIFRALEKHGFYRPCREQARLVQQQIDERRAALRRFMLGF
ncbi:MAG: DNA-directed RNA polymerase subunit alpha C-terminal domain-containing protein [Pirellulaceae bacterium]